MGNNTSNDVKRTFEELDTDHSGNISLFELIHAKHHKGNLSHFDSRTCSLTTLYLFDAHKAGSLTFKEFAELDRFVQKIAKKVEKQHKKKLGGLALFLQRIASNGHLSMQMQNPLMGPNSNESNDSLWETVNREETRMFTSYIDDNITTTTNNNSNNSTNSGNNISDSDEEEELIQEVKSTINAQLLPVLKKHLSHKKGREQFLDWLFKVADWQHDNRITMEELDLILRAVQQDGIDLHSLLFDETINEKNETLAQHIMSEYDFLHRGSLTKDEFMMLGEIILHHYEISQQNHEHIGPWELTHNLGEGSYGVVKCGVHVETGERRAIKIIKRGNVSDMSRLDIEIQAMKMLKHPQIVQLENVLSTEEHVYLVMELCGGGSLYAHLADQPIEEDLARYYFNQLVDGLAYCHSHGVCHRDLRLENLLLDNSGALRITDFGQARIFKKGWDLFSTQLVGSLYHLSPEQTLGQCYSGEKVDIWSAGIILYYFLVARFPFRSMDVVEMFDCIRHARYDIPDFLSPDSKDLIQRILQVDPNKRPTLEEIKNHPWTIGTQKQPELMQHRITLESSVASWQNAQGWASVESILDELNVYYLLSKTPTEIVPKSTTLRVLKCLHPATELKFSISLIAVAGEHDNKIMMQFNLRDGESKEFLKLVQKFNKAFRKQIKCTPTTMTTNIPNSTDVVDNLTCSCSSNPQDISTITNTTTTTDNNETTGSLPDDRDCESQEEVAAEEDDADDHSSESIPTTTTPCEQVPDV